MTKEEAKKYLIDISYQLGTMDIEYLSEKDGEKMREAIKVLEQEPEAGHWEWLTEDKYRCSNCNNETRVDECMNEPLYSFCPFCGAEMRGR